MNEKEYLDLIQDLYDNVNEENVDVTLQKLDELFHIKPVRTIWFAAKAKALVVQSVEKNDRDIHTVLLNKIFNVYDHKGAIEGYNAYLDYFKYYGLSVEERRVRYEINRLALLQKPDDAKVISEINNEHERLNVVVTDYLNNGPTPEKLAEMIELFYIKREFVLAGVFELLSNLLYSKTFESINWIYTLPNMGYLFENEKKLKDIILIAGNENDLLYCEAAANALANFSKVYLFDIPMQVEVPDLIELESTLAISLDNVEMYGDIMVFHPIEIVCGGRVIGDNREYIIDYINKHYAEKNLSTVICSGALLDELSLRPLMMKQLGRLDNFLATGYDDSMAFAWSGSYLSYISEIYDFDTEEAINSPAECDFSIVIPARNSSYTLRYAIKTCLDIEYNGSYEIVISDNSTEGNHEVYELIKELNDDRIKYYKTPRDLHLPKSFEYAFLKAKGEFILSIGSDDGILPWSLTTLKEILDNYKEEEIIRWDRGFYAWPKFNERQEHQFVIPKDYTKNDYGIKKINAKELLAKILVDPKKMYLLPMLYINSGFRRSYFKTLISKTGRLWDGICQDIYMGVISIAINKEILSINYPLTIAGMSNGSVGQLANASRKTISDSNDYENENMKTGNVGGFSLSLVERLIPEFGSDVTSLYNSLLRAVARGVMPMEYLNKIFDFKRMYLESINLMRKDDIMYDRNIHYARYSAAKHGEEFLKWFDEVVYPIVMKPIEVSESKEEKPSGRSYEVSENSKGVMTLDASEYGVANIDDAVKLFAEVSKLA